MGKSTVEKFLKYVKRGSLDRVKSYLRKERINVNEVLDNRQRTALHVASYLGEDAIVRILLKYGANTSLVDKQGNTAVHLAINYAIEVRSRTVYEDLVKPLMRFSSSVLDLENDDGKTPNYLLGKLKHVLQEDFNERLQEEKIEEDTLEERRKKQEEEDEWREKMFHEMGNDMPYDESWTCDEDQESYDQWANRIRQEFNERHRKRTNHNATNKSQEQEKAREETERLQREHEAYLQEISRKRMEKTSETRKLLYDSRCDELFAPSCNTELCYDNMPWPCQESPSDMVKLLISWAKTTDEKTYLREQQVRWHPDKFLQRCGKRLNENDKERVMETVKEISQEFNSYMDANK